MGQSSRHGADLTPDQVNVFKLSVSAACRRMSADQILDLADHLHDIIRKRGACCKFAEFAVYDACDGGIARDGAASEWELAQ